MSMRTKLARRRPAELVGIGLALVSGVLAAWLLASRSSEPILPAALLLLGATSLVLFGLTRRPGSSEGQGSPGQVRSAHRNALPCNRRRGWGGHRSDAALFPRAIRLTSL